ncbi:MAG: DUF1080 domain-containing protein [Bacteroidota bacterium]
MKWPLYFILSIFVCCPSCQLNQEGERTAYIQLFLEDHDDWIQQGDANWAFEEGELIGKSDSSAGFVITKASFDEFQLKLEFKPDSTINSGIYIQCRSEVMDAISCREINIWDLHPNQSFRTGALVGMAEPLKVVHTIGKWNTYKIIAKNHRIQAWVNQQQTLDVVDSSFTKGTIALQAAGSGQIRFRQVELSLVED